MVRGECSLNKRDRDWTHHERPILSAGVGDGLGVQRYAAATRPDDTSYWSATMPWLRGADVSVRGGNDGGPRGLAHIRVPALLLRRDGRSSIQLEQTACKAISKAHVGYRTLGGIMRRPTVSPAKQWPSSGVPSLLGKNSREQRPRHRQKANFDHYNYRQQQKPHRSYRGVVVRRFG